MKIDTEFKSLKRIAQKQTADAFVQHLMVFVCNDFSTFHYEQRENLFKIWRLSYWFGAFYPVIIFNKQKTKNTYSITLTTKLNSFGKSILFALSLGWLAWVFLNIISFENFHWQFLILRILVSIVILFLPAMAFFLAFKNEKKCMLKDLEMNLAER